MSCKSRTILEIFWISAGFSLPHFFGYPFAQPKEHYSDRLICELSIIYPKYDKPITPATNEEGVLKHPLSQYFF